MERAAGIEPASSAWKAEVLPLNYARVTIQPNQYLMKPTLLPGFKLAPLKPSKGPDAETSLQIWWREVDSNHRSFRVRFTV